MLLNYFTELCESTLFLAVIGRVQKGESPPFRPRVTKDTVGHALYIDMMKQCWDQDPDARPKFSDCNKYLKQMNKGK